MPDPLHTSVSVVIPVLNAGKYLSKLLPAILDQKPVAPGEIVLVDSMSRDNTVEIAKQFPQVRVVPIENFSHGRARNLGVREARGEVVVLMTQDALPQDQSWLAKLLAPLADPRVAATYSRQVPYDDASPMERYFLETHFPAGPAVERVKQGDETLNLGNVFFSNVAAALRRDLLLKFPFDETLIMSEDQQVSRDLLHAGFSVVYVPDSIVVHSHNYKLRTVFRRYFDSVYSLTVIFKEHDVGTSASMGFRYLGQEAVFMLRRHPRWLPYYFCYTVMKTTGTLAGHFAEVLPRSLVKKLSMHSYHWDG
ncbi:MAG TPA: glycosyltransferase [Kiritimatiellia bacterium]|jgi:rhamnosyltransferase